MADNVAEAGCIIPVLLIMVYGLLILSKVPFSIFWIIPIVICLISIVFSVDYSSKGNKHYKTIESKTVQDHHKRVNSNIVNNSVKTHTPSSSQIKSKPIKLAKPQALFCHFCGTQIDLDTRPIKLTKLHALFCHQCGTQIDLDTKPIKLAKLNVLFCHLCETRIDPDALFCHQCGTKLE
jgi:hypothetical protein